MAADSHLTLNRLAYIIYEVNHLELLVWRSLWVGGWGMKQEAPHWSLKIAPQSNLKHLISLSGKITVTNLSYKVLENQRTFSLFLLWARHPPTNLPTNQPKNGQKHCPPKGSCCCPRCRRCRQEGQEEHERYMKMRWDEDRDGMGCGGEGMEIERGELGTCWQLFSIIKLSP